MEKLLILSDDRRWRDALAAELTARGHQAAAAALPDAAPELLQGRTAVLADLREQGASPVRLTRVRRALGPGKPYLLAVLTCAQAAQLDLSLGFDDFLVEPFGAPEVVARVRQLRWRENRTETADVLKAGDLVVNRASCEVALQGVPLALTFQEYELLRYLMEHRGRVFTRERLLNELWGYDYYGGTRTVDVHVRRLRAKLGPEHQDLIQTVRNVGYRFAREP
ncbi:MAG: response regulator transcription factor [Armatimonadetes bacterium]|nr:response regulator transcription factor [Armatimonadota bacterium]